MPHFTCNELARLERSLEEAVALRNQLAADPMGLPETENRVGLAQFNFNCQVCRVSSRWAGRSSARRLGET